MSLKNKGLINLQKTEIMTVLKEQMKVNLKSHQDFQKRKYDCLERANENALAKSLRLARLRNFAFMKKLNETAQEKSQRLERRRLKRVTKSTAKRLVRLAKQEKNEIINETADKNVIDRCKKPMYMESTRHFGSAIKLRCSCLCSNKKQKAVKNTMGERSSQKVKKKTKKATMKSSNM